jgi:beta-phosphoglucomutase-like phosphatase (HAD superfamily)
VVAGSAGLVVFALIWFGAASNLGLEPARCVVVEDSVSGIDAARAAGIGYLTALGPAHAHKRLTQREGVNQVVESLWQIPKRRLFLV